GAAVRVLQPWPGRPRRRDRDRNRPMTPSALFTDFYELTMMAGYADAGLADCRATFDLYFRRPPEGVCVIVAAGQELALDHLEALRFTDDDLAYLRQQHLPDGFVDSLRDVRFTGD